MSKFRSNRQKIQILKRGLILCEGQTEEMYFKGLITQDKYRRDFGAVSVEIYKPKDHSPKGLVTEAKNRIKAAKKDDAFDFVWIVFDHDGHENIPDTFEQALHSKPPIHIAFTMKCFEYFVLLHFTKTTKAFNKCDDVITAVKAYIPDYQKASNNIFTTLAAHHETGMANSAWSLERNKPDIDAGSKPYELSSYSNIHELVGYLISLVQTKAEEAVTVKKSAAAE